jgi:ligand-binding sensor domain-containing protein
MVQCILEDKAGNLWLGERAGGVSRYDSITGKFIKVNGSCFSNQIMAIVEDNSGSIWIANLYDGLCKYDPVSGTYRHITKEDGLCHPFLSCAYKDKTGNLWFGSDGGRRDSSRGGLCRYDGKSFTFYTVNDGLTHQEVWTIVEDNEGNIWIGTKGGLYRWHAASAKFIDYTHKVNLN